MARPLPEHDLTADKKCLKCKIVKPASSFRLTIIDNIPRLGSYCFTCDKDKSFETMLWYKFKLTVGQYEAILKAQNGVCAICKKPESAIGRGMVVKRLAVDHDSKTGKVCGLLCWSCNVSIGRFNHDFEIISNAAKYVERTRSK